MTGIPSDHPSVSTIRGRIAEDAMGRPRLVVDDAAAFPTGEDGEAAVVRVVVDDVEGYARPRSGRGDDAVVVTGVYDAPEIARDPGGDATNRLREWAREGGLSADDPVLVDVLQSGARYGLRAPGERTVYPERRVREDSLSSIARDLDG